MKKTELFKKSVSDGIREMDELITMVSGEKALEEFVNGRQLDRYKKKQRIFSEGNHPLRLYYVQKGMVKIYKTNNYGKELIVKIIGENEFFGYTELLFSFHSTENVCPCF